MSFGILYCLLYSFIVRGEFKDGGRSGGGNWRFGDDGLVCGLGGRETLISYFLFLF